MDQIHKEMPLVPPAEPKPREWHEGQGDSQNDK